MAIKYNADNKLFILETINTSYIISVTDKEGFLGHVYYGSRINNVTGLNYLLRTHEPPFVPSVNSRDRLSFLDSFPTEYGSNGVGDFRHSSITALSEGANWTVLPLYDSHVIYDGKNALEGLPYCFGGKKQCQSLEILCKDNSAELEITLLYTVFPESDIITRSVKVKNIGSTNVQLEKVLSFSFDMDNEDYDVITLHGAWARERHVQRYPAGKGYQGVSSSRGESGHQDHPFMALVEKNTTQNSGNAYGFSFVYSGNFIAEAAVNQFDSLRVSMGINPENFSWKLESGYVFVSPEVMMTFSNSGIGGMSRNFHKGVKNHLIRSSFKDTERPILINNWEATYFDFDTDKLIAIAKEASKAGIEMLVMDDGWFGGRSSDNMALGDWQVNKNKITGGLSYLVEEVNKLGMKFGIWFEPEMISPDSDLYRKHPDWAIQVPSRVPGLARNQLVLDLTRPEAFDYVYSCISEVLHSANIAYVKWDMNRPHSDVGSTYLGKDRQGEVEHRNVLAVYKMQEKLITEFPELLLENCSSGGARFDAGMLFYSPQIWTSDDMDPIERLSIQEGTAMVYPLSTMGAHVCVCPNHSTGRTTPFTTRGHVALAGTFGYELDITKLSDEDKALIPQQIAMYKKYNKLVRDGDYYRIANYSENHEFDCWQVVSPDWEEALVPFVQVLNRPNVHSRKVKLFGLDAAALYTVTCEKEEQGELYGYAVATDSENEASGTTFGNEKSASGEKQSREYSGDVLMNGGLIVDNMWGDFKSCLFHVVKK